MCFTMHCVLTYTVEWWFRPVSCGEAGTTANYIATGWHKVWHTFIRHVTTYCCIDRRNDRVVATGRLWTMQFWNENTVNLKNTILLQQPMKRTHAIWRRKISLSWDPFVEIMALKCKSVKRILRLHNLKQLYYSLVHSHITYGTTPSKLN
jgi:hypothetical protein